MEAWNAFLRNLENQFGSQSIRKWLWPLEVVNYDSCNIYLSAENSFQIAWFEEHIRPLVSKELFNNNSRPIKVHLLQQNKRKKKPQHQVSSSLNFEIKSDFIDPMMTFSNFIYDEKTKLTSKFLQNLTSDTFNPIFLWGDLGVGKTHLLHAVANQLSSQNLSVFYIHCETFTQHVVEAIRTSQMQAFRNIYRSLDVLIIDDIHLFARRSATQEEFFHTFNALHTAGKQVIFCSHLLPSQMKDIEPRLISRFEWGIILDLLPLNASKMKLVLKNKADVHNFALNDEIIEFLIFKFSPKPKSILCALEALMLRHHSKQKVTLPIAENLLKDLVFKQNESVLNPEKIVFLSATYFGIRSEDIMGKSQAKECATPRKLAMYLCRKHLSLSYKSIGRFFQRDHSTVMTSIKQVQNNASNEIEAALNELEKTVKSL